MNTAFEIAKDNLKACFKENGIVASIDHFSDFWARDSFYASWGLLKIKEFEKVKSNLNLFIKHQKSNGHIPRRIDRYIVPLKYLGIKIKRKSLKPRYTGVYVYPALDSNILFIITCYKYYKHSHDLAFIKNNYKAIRKAMDWLEKYEKNNLLTEGLFANWADIIIKRGTVLYTNILYSESLRSLKKIFKELEETRQANKYYNKLKKVKEKINVDFWNGNYYIDWINKKKKYDFLSTDGNVLAMLFDISGIRQNKEIIKYIEKYELDKIPMKTNYPSYSWWRVKLIMRIIGAPGYQNNSTSWLWLGCIYAVALHQNGYKKKGKDIYDKISFKIQEYNKVYEIYSSKGIPYKGWYWSSASSFAWSSGLYLWMDKLLEKQ